MPAPLKEALLWASRNETLRHYVGNSELVWPLVERFVAGETLSEALLAVEQLNKQGIAASLDHLGEEVADPNAIAAVRQEYTNILESINSRRLKANVSLKLSQYGLLLNPEICLANLFPVLRRAQELGIFVRFDMEGSNCTNETLALFYRILPYFNNVGVVMQANLYRTRKDVQKLIAHRARVRLCKGAYKEPSVIAYPHKRDVDTAYIALMQELLVSGNYPAIATHDEEIINEAKRIAQLARVPKHRFEFQMLYGIRRDLQQGLVEEGYRMRVYIPYGKQWYPYLMRRMAERPANMLFVAKNIIQETRTSRS